MKREYRIKATQRKDIDDWLNTRYMDVAPRFNVYAVKMCISQRKHCKTTNKKDYGNNH